MSEVKEVEQTTKQEQVRCYACGDEFIPDDETGQDKNGYWCEECYENEITVYCNVCEEYQTDDSECWHVIYDSNSGEYLGVGAYGHDHYKDDKENFFKFLDAVSEKLKEDKQPLEAFFTEFRSSLVSRKFDFHLWGQSVLGGGSIWFQLEGVNTKYNSLITDLAWEARDADDEDLGHDILNGVQWLLGLNKPKDNEIILKGVDLTIRWIDWYVNKHVPGYSTSIKVIALEIAQAALQDYKKEVWLHEFDEEGNATKTKLSLIEIMSNVGEFDCFFADNVREPARLKIDNPNYTIIVKMEKEQRSENQTL